MNRSWVLFNHEHSWIKYINYSGTVHEDAMNLLLDNSLNDESSWIWLFMKKIFMNIHQLSFYEEKFMILKCPIIRS